ncbi:hypothetical protein P7C70_g3084, partial [Phenoliferia sp. Uapishka_3]
MQFQLPDLPRRPVSTFRTGREVRKGDDVFLEEKEKKEKRMEKGKGKARAEDGEERGGESVVGVCTCHGGMEGDASWMSSKDGGAESDFVCHCDHSVMGDEPSVRPISPVPSSTSTARIRRPQSPVPEPTHYHRNKSKPTTSTTSTSAPPSVTLQRPTPAQPFPRRRSPSTAPPPISNPKIKPKPKPEPTRTLLPAAQPPPAPPPPARLKRKTKPKPKTSGYVSLVSDTEIARFERRRDREKKKSALSQTQACSDGWEGTATMNFEKLKSGSELELREPEGWEWVRCPVYKESSEDDEGEEVEEEEDGSGEGEGEGEEEKLEERKKALLRRLEELKGGGLSGNGKAAETETETDMEEEILARRRRRVERVRLG